MRGNIPWYTTRSWLEKTLWWSPNRPVTPFGSAISNTRGHLNSFHAYFLHVGNCRHELEYTVSPLRVGRESSRVQVQAKQKHRHLFQMMSSYSQDNAHNLGHTPSPPRVPHPDTVPTDHQMLIDLAETFPASSGLQSFIRRRLHVDSGLDIKPISPENFLHSTQNSIHRRLWFRMRSMLPSEYASLLLAYTSDFLLVGTSLQPQNLSILSPNVKFVSLDHSMWFYQAVPQNAWILLDAKSEVYANNRSLVQGDFYTQSGTHIASCKQEGFFHIRQRAAKI